ncbi:hypothetical protein L211DRAFT_644643 [Terfezia boudieri ATCC MYA-4762]|uniref:Uncharacterized protein n=1 Tax=Terfezia boudieri ATCC MYA-4762 TaxID=1051890 RepID=A0A3N4LV16_9PEZI|nr:hypothetical protein L211DRAFT_644643 [Terfezia boudieri ATCC MYA-4762]
MWVLGSHETCPCSFLRERRTWKCSTAIIHHVIKDTSTSDYPQCHQESLYKRCQ